MQVGVNWCWIRNFSFKIIIWGNIFSDIFQVNQYFSSINFRNISQHFILCLLVIITNLSWQSIPVFQVQWNLCNSLPRGTKCSKQLNLGAWTNCTCICIVQKIIKTNFETICLRLMIISLGEANWRNCRK